MLASYARQLHDAHYVLAGAQWALQLMQPKPKAPKVASTTAELLDAIGEIAEPKRRRIDEAEWAEGLPEPEAAPEIGDNVIPFPASPTKH